MFCPKCGTENLDCVKFCLMCGTKLKETEINSYNTKNFKTVTKARTEYVLPSDVEKDIKSGISYAKCKKKLQAKNGFSDLTSKELNELVSTAGSRIFNEQNAKQFEKDFKYYKILPCSDACPICKEKSKKKIRFRERKVGVNFPPLHIGCRCSFTVEIPKDFIKKH